MTKTVADDLPKLYIWQLARAGLFARPGLIADIRYKDDIFAGIYVDRYTKYIKIKYLNSEIPQYIEFTKTKCHLGGFRYWFTCSFCQKRVGVLYLSDSYFKCRSCGNLTYESKNKNYRKKSYNFLKPFDNYFKANDLSDQLKRFSYAGKPTKKVRRINYLYEHSIFL